MRKGLQHNTGRDLPRRPPLLLCAAAAQTGRGACRGADEQHAAAMALVRRRWRKKRQSRRERGEGNPIVWRESVSFFGAAGQGRGRFLSRAAVPPTADRAGPGGSTVHVRCAAAAAQRAMAGGRRGTPMSELCARHAHCAWHCCIICKFPPVQSNAGAPRCQPWRMDCCTCGV